jgi:hypothetical protein
VDETNGADDLASGQIDFDHLASSDGATVSPDGSMVDTGRILYVEVS